MNFIEERAVVVEAQHWHLQGPIGSRWRTPAQLAVADVLLTDHMSIVPPRGDIEQQFEEAAAAQLRLNEINDAHPRRVAKWEKSETVLEGDAEWCARQSPALADEFRRLGAVSMGKCAITGQPGCAHPFKCGLTPNQKRSRPLVARYERAKKLLRDQGKS